MPVGLPGFGAKLSRKQLPQSCPSLLLPQPCAELHCVRKIPAQGKIELCMCTKALMVSIARHADQSQQGIPSSITSR